MTLLNFDSDNSARKSSGKGFKVILGTGFLIGALAIGNTLAANISLNSGGNVEFGQGLTQTVVCGGADVSITIMPKSTFTNVQGGGSYRFSSFEVSDIPTECIGVDFTFKFYGESGGQLDPIGYDWTGAEYPNDFNRTDITVHFLGENTTGFGTNNLWNDDWYGFPGSKSYPDVNSRPDPVDSRTSSSFEVTFLYDSAYATGLLTDDLKRITAETSRINYAVGDTGPGGGIVFLTPESSNTPYYYEVAPVNASGTYNLCSDQNSRSLSDEIGAGFANSATLYADENCNASGNAAYGSHNFENGGYSDWYLPSRLEMAAVRRNVVDLLSDVASRYLTSSQMSANSVWTIAMDNPNENVCGHGSWTCTDYKNGGGNYMRPIRRWQ